MTKAFVDEHLSRLAQGQGREWREVQQARFRAGSWLQLPVKAIGMTVQVTREGDQWMIRYNGRVVAEHAVLAGRLQLSVKPEHGPGAAMRNQRQRFAEPPS